MIAISKCNACVGVMFVSMNGTWCVLGGVMFRVKILVSGGLFVFIAPSATNKVDFAHSSLEWA